MEPHELAGANAGVVSSVRPPRSPRASAGRPDSPDVFTPKQWEAVDLSDTHLMLLYLINKYSDSEQVDGSGDRWVRGIPLLVLMYEAIVDQVLDYDYAPQSVKVGRRRIFMNITQEGRDDIDDLREAGLVLSLKLTNNLNNNITAFKASKAGELALEILDGSIKQQVDDFIQLAPGPAGLKRVKCEQSRAEQRSACQPLHCPAPAHVLAALALLARCLRLHRRSTPVLRRCAAMCRCAL